MLALWIGFIAVVLTLISLDLFVFHRKDEVMSVKSALKWSTFWIALALAFGGFVYWAYDTHLHGLGLPRPHSKLHPNGLDGFEAVSVYLTGYILELSLSVDNLFVIAVIFGYFAVPAKYQHRVLFWGIMGVLVMRGAMIGIGAALIKQFDWILYVFGLILLFTAYKMLFSGGEADPKNNPVLRIARKLFPVTHEYHGHQFLVRESQLREGEEMEEGDDHHITKHHVGGATPASAGKAASTAVAVQADAAPAVATAEPAAVAVPATPVEHAKPATSSSNRWVLTPLAMALIVVETTDLIFAVDSIPAIFAITDDPFIVFTSNVCAVLGLRSLFFALAGILEKFEYLKISLAAILALVGVKMLAHKYLHSVENLNLILLGVVFLMLGAGVVASLMLPPKHKKLEGQAAGHAASPAGPPTSET